MKRAEVGDSSRRCLCVRKQKRTEKDEIGFRRRTVGSRNWGREGREVERRVRRTSDGRRGLVTRGNDGRA